MMKRKPKCVDCGIEDGELDSYDGLAGGPSQWRTTVKKRPENNNRRLCDACNACEIGLDDAIVAEEQAAKGQRA